MIGSTRSSKSPQPVTLTKTRAPHHTPAVVAVASDRIKRLKFVSFGKRIRSSPGSGFGRDGALRRHRPYSGRNMRNKPPELSGDYVTCGGRAQALASLTQIDYSHPCR